MAGDCAEGHDGNYQKSCNMSTQRRGTTTKSPLRRTTIPLSVIGKMEGKKRCCYFSGRVKSLSTILVYILHTASESCVHMSFGPLARHRVQPRPAGMSLALPSLARSMDMVDKYEDADSEDVVVRRFHRKTSES